LIMIPDIKLTVSLLRGKGAVAIVMGYYTRMSLPVTCISMLFHLQSGLAEWFSAQEITGY
jgi:hypothetical protein